MSRLPPDAMLRATCRIGLLLALCALVPWRVAHAQQAGDVPYVPTPSNVIAAMLDMALVNANDYLIDLGSGDGRIVIEAAKKNGAHGMGVELDANLVFTARQEAGRQGVGGKATFVAGNLFHADLSKATVLTMYLLGQINIQLRPRLLSELKPGTRVVSHDFDMGSWRPDLQREVPVPNKSYGPPLSRIYLWYVPANATGKWRWELTVGGRSRVYEARVKQFFQEIDGEMLIDGASAAAQNVKLRGDLIGFNLTREMFGQQISHVFNGRIEGDRIVGRVTISGGGEDKTLDWEATRVERGRMRTE